MKFLFATLLSILLIQPNTWAEPPAEPTDATDKQELLVAEQEQDTKDEGGEEESSKEKKFDKIFDFISKKIETEAGDELTDQERAEIREGLLEAKEALQDIDEITIDVGGDASFMEMLVGMIAVILIFGGPLLIVAIVLYSSYRKASLNTRNHQQLCRKRQRYSCRDYGRPAKTIRPQK